MRPPLVANCVSPWGWLKRASRHAEDADQQNASPIKDQTSGSDYAKQEAATTTQFDTPTDQSTMTSHPPAASFVTPLPPHRGLRHNLPRPLIYSHRKEDSSPLNST